MGNSQNIQIDGINNRSVDKTQIDELPSTNVDLIKLNAIYLGLVDKLNGITAKWDSEVALRKKIKLLGLTLWSGESDTMENYLNNLLSRINFKATQQGKNNFEEWFLDQELKELEHTGCSSVINFTQTLDCNGMSCKAVITLSGKIECTLDNADACFTHIARNIKKGKCNALQVVYSQMVSVKKDGMKSLHRVAFIVERSPLPSTEVIVTVYCGGHDWNVDLGLNMDIFKNSLASHLAKTTFTITMRMHGAELCGLGVQLFLRGKERGRKTLDQGFCQVYSLLWLYFAMRVAALGPPGEVYTVMDNFDLFFISTFKNTPGELYTFVLRFALYYVAYYIQTIVPSEFPKDYGVITSLVGNKRKQNDTEYGEERAKRRSTG